MPYMSRFSTHLSSQKIQSIFLGARFGKYTYCVRCQSDRIYKADSTVYRCRNCWYTFRTQTGTYLVKKRIPLRLWYEIVYSFAIGLPARKTQRVLKIKEYRTVYTAYKIIRKAIMQHSKQNEKKLKGTIEVDESFYGGEFKNLRKETRKKLRKLGLAKRGRGAKYRKQPVFGIYKRNGKVYLELIPDAKKQVLEDIITKRIEKKEHIFSDTHTGYHGLVGLGYIHRTVNHSRKEYVKGQVHINGIEGFWGLSKTNMHTYKGIRKKNWNEYIKEMEFRYNYRDLEYDDLTLQIIKVLCQKPEQISLSS